MISFAITPVYCEGSTAQCKWAPHSEWLSDPGRSDLSDHFWFDCRAQLRPILLICLKDVKAFNIHFNERQIAEIKDMVRQYSQRTPQQKLYSRQIFSFKADEEPFI